MRGLQVLQIGMDEALQLMDRQENAEYKAFVEKFKPKKTTDDCYTPEPIYEAVAEWVREEYGVPREKMLRPFWPGGDYQREEYPEGCCVVDNPPFSILGKVIQWYDERKIPFFLFAPALTTFTANRCRCCYICTEADITYENGANVKTNFITSLDPYRIRSAPELYRRVKAAMERHLRAQKKQKQKYAYPNEVVLCTMVNRYSKYGIDFRIQDDECRYIGSLDCQREDGKDLFGGGYLISERAAAERAAAHPWPLSEREKEIVRELGKREEVRA